MLGADGMIVATTRVFGGLDEAVERGTAVDLPSGGVSEPRPSDFPSAVI